MTAADLRDELAELAARADNYADADAALARASRVCRGRVVAPLAAAVAVVAVLLGVLAQPGPARSPAPPATMGPEGHRYPSQVVPAPDAPTLPTNRGVGTAVLVYQACLFFCGKYLVLADGRQYTLHPYEPEETSVVFPVSLSPDGRWLATYQPDDSVALRDLLSGTVRDLPRGTGLPSWSPNGRWALGANHMLYDLSGPKPNARPVAHADIRAVLDSGELAVRDPGSRGNVVQFHLVDPVSGKTRPLIIDARRVLPAGQTVTPPAGVTAPSWTPSWGATYGLLPIHQGRDHVGWLVFTVADGRFVRRLPVNGTGILLGFDGDTLLSRSETELQVHSVRSGAGGERVLFPAGARLATRAAPWSYSAP